MKFYDRSRILFGLLIVGFRLCCHAATSNELTGISFPLFEGPVYVSESVTEIRQRIKSAGASPQPYDLFLLGMKLYSQSNYTECAKTFIRASDIGYPDASFAASVCLMQSIGVERDVDQAFLHLNRSIRYPSISALKLSSRMDTGNALKRALFLKYASFGGDKEAARTLRTASSAMTDDEHMVAFDIPQQKPKVFQGLKTFSVAILMSDDVKKNFNEDQIRSLVELKIRSSGLKVVSPDFAKIPELKVTFTGFLSERDSLLTFIIKVSCNDIVLHRFTPILSQIYSGGQIGDYGKANFDKIYGEIEREVSKFCNVVLADQE